MSVFIPSCHDAQETEAYTLSTALQYLLTSLPNPKYPEAVEQIALMQSLGRILAQPIYSPVNVPAQTNSAMDGYAIRGVDLQETELKSTLTVIGTAFAGHPFTGTVARGQCVRIMTGAVIPDGADTVLMQERVTVQGDKIQFQTGENSGQNVRYAGEDVAIGQQVLAAGTKIYPAELGLIAALGIAEIPVFKPVRVAFFSTGDELRPVGEILEKGQIYDSNRYTLFGMLSRLGIEVLDFGSIPDKPDLLAAALVRASEQADAIISSGGVSVGEADFIKPLLAELGEIQFWKLAIKPGRPFAFGKIKNAFFFGLPGNPVSTMVTFYQLVQPALQKLMGIHPLPLQLGFKAKSNSKFKKQQGRTEFPRGFLKRAANGEWTVSSVGAQGSGILSSMTAANCFIILAAEQATVEIGDWVEVQPFNGLV